VLLGSARMHPHPFLFASAASGGCKNPTQVTITQRREVWVNVSNVELLTMLRTMCRPHSRPIPPGKWNTWTKKRRDTSPLPQTYQHLAGNVHWWSQRTASRKHTNIFLVGATNSTTVNNDTIELARQH
jgi:hypothetical protein